MWLSFSIFSRADKDHLRLAAGKAFLQLSKRYDAQISAPIFHAVVLLAMVTSITLSYFFRLFLINTNFSLCYKFFYLLTIPFVYRILVILWNMGFWRNWKSFWKNGLFLRSMYVPLRWVLVAMSMTNSWQKWDSFYYFLL